MVRAGRVQLGWYLGGTGVGALANGAQMVLFPWLVALVIGASASRVGIAQACLMIPALIFLLPAGAAADRNDPRRLLVLVHALSALPPFALAARLAFAEVGYAELVAYALATGTILAFAVPARDSLLTRVSAGDIQRGVMAAIIAMNIAQLAGAAIGGMAATIGAGWVLAVQGVAQLGAAAMTARLLPAPPSGAARANSRLAEIAAGLRELASSPRILPVTLLSMAIGLLFMGAFLVAMPLLVRDVYHGSSAQIAWISASMSLGMLAGTSTLFARGGVQRQGRALVLALVGGAAALGSLSLHLPLPLVYALVFVFGACGGVAVPAGRTIVQESAPETHRARVLAGYQLSFMGAAPAGAFAMGQLCERLGPLDAIVLPASAMLVVVAATALLTDVWRIEGRSRAERRG